MAPAAQWPPFLCPRRRTLAFGTTLTAGYTGDGLRAWKQGGAGRTYFLYDGDQPVCELDSDGGVTAVNTFGAGGLLSRYTPGGGSVFYTFDPSGNTALRLDGSGNVLSADLYDAFGRGQTTASAPDVFGFGARWGGYTDALTGLVLFGHRYYDPANGRWLTRDPMGYGGGLDLYAYTGNNPVNRSDPSGLMTLGVGGGGLGFGVPTLSGGILGGGFDGTIEADSDGTVAISCDVYVVQGPGVGAGVSPEGTVSPGNIGYNPGTGILGTVGGFSGVVGSTPWAGGTITEANNGSTTFPGHSGPPTVSGGHGFLPGRPVIGGGPIAGVTVTAGWNLPEVCRSIANECNQIANSPTANAPW